MGYNECIEAAGVKVIAYREDNDYQGRWIAYTERGFYTGYFGSCSYCDKRQGEHESLRAIGMTAHDIDARIGRAILDEKPLTIDELIKEYHGIFSEEEIAWAKKVIY